MKVLVTGATGFIGHKFAERLASEGHEVFALVRKTSDKTRIPDGVQIREGDMLDEPSLKEAVKGVQAVVHFAAYFDFYPRDKGLLYRVNIDGTRMLANACVGKSVERFIYCSSTEAIGPVAHPPANEESELRPSFDYGHVKDLAEQVVRQVTKDTGLPHIILRPTGVMGEGDFYTAYEVIKALNEREIPVLPGDGEKSIMYTYVDDVVDGFVKALTSGNALNNTIILCPDVGIKYKDLIEFFCTCLGVKPPKRRVPTTLAMLGIGLLSPMKNRKKNTFLWHMKTVRSMDEERTYSNEKAKQLLGWTPKYTMQEGIKRVIDWYFANGHLQRKG
ncbi:MAG: hypothetical protein C4K49_09855 [Candidatus Thorarchaeota archaeon]|nr:MAG: hypothetical protein C4K49_09855 [Candidatus Thorarchaeota archaeon]